MEKVTRIRYTKTEGGLLVSKPMLASSGVITVTLDPSTNTYKVHSNGNATEPVDTGGADSLVKLKLMVKAKVKEMGVVFFDEVRTSKKGEKTDGQ